MAENDSNASAQPTAPQGKPIPEQTVVAEHEMQLDLSAYFTAPEDETLDYSIENLPEGLSIGAESGILSGIAPKVEIKTPFFVSVTATSQQTQQSATLYFPLTIIPELAEPTPESEEELAEEPGVFTEALEDVSFWDAAREWELMKFIQHLISKYYAFIYIYPMGNPPTSIPPGELIGTLKARSGWNIFDYGDLMMAVPGDTAFAEYGYRARLQATMEELFQSELLDKKQWKTIDMGGSDLESLNRAWVVARKLNINVNEQAPSETAEVNYINLMRLFEKTGFTPPRPI